MPPKKPRQSAVARLVAMIGELTPFLDSFGAAYCRMPHAEPEKRIVLLLTDTSVRDLLLHRYRRTHHACPTWKQITQAMADVRGKLLETWERPVVVPDDRTLRAMIKASNLKEYWCGSSTELLDLLVAVDHEHFILKAKGSLPESPDAMGTCGRT